MQRFGTLSFEEEQDQAELEAEDIAQELLGANEEELDAVLEAHSKHHRKAERERGNVDKAFSALQALREMAEDAEREDPKLSALLEQIRAIRSTEPDANILVYTEYTDSQDAVLTYLNGALTDGRVTGTVVGISGRDDQKARDSVTLHFTEEDCIVLVSTDATAEGLNLHRRCHHLIHLELPYNPNRLEQRNGRIDRHGQAETPEVRYLYLGDTFEERLLLRLVARSRNSCSS
jgi:superfamily II DNA/RNA helicase